MSSSEQNAVVDIGLAVIVHTGRVLIARRNPETVLGGCWEFPGGKLQPGETPAECVCREVNEEVGLQVEAAAPFAVIEHEYPHGRVRLHCCRCRLLAGSPRALECAEVRWVLPADLPRYPFPEANAPLLRQLAAESGDER